VSGEDHFFRRLVDILETEARELSGEWTRDQGIRHRIEFEDTLESEIEAERRATYAERPAVRHRAALSARIAAEECERAGVPLLASDEQHRAIAAALAGGAPRIVVTA